MPAMSPRPAMHTRSQLQAFTHSSNKLTMPCHATRLVRLLRSGAYSEQRWVDAYAIGCGVLATTRTIVPRKEIQWHNGTPQEKF